LIVWVGNTSQGLKSYMMGVKEGLRHDDFTQ